MKLSIKELEIMRFALKIELKNTREGSFEFYNYINFFNRINEEIYKKESKLKIKLANETLREVSKFLDGYSCKCK